MKSKLKLIIKVLFCGLTFMTINVHSQNLNSGQEKKCVPVTWESFVRAETDRTFKNYVTLGAFGKFLHMRSVTPIDKQDVVRLNRDTRYSIGIFDLTTPLTVALPDTRERYLSMQIINQDEYTKSVGYKPGNYTITQQSVGSRYVCLIIRILVNAEDEQDNQLVSEIQNQITAVQKDVGRFEIPDWDQPSLDKLREAIKIIASTLTDVKLCFGDISDVNPIAHFIGTAAGWGGLPQKDAIYINSVPEENDGKTSYLLIVKDVPIDGFWSISVYNKDGFFEKNQFNMYSVNNFSAKKEKDGSIKIHFGGDPQSSNYLPLTEGWNYSVRLYSPHEEILNGSWKFPEPSIVK
jgi:hypothetical protein